MTTLQAPSDNWLGATSEIPLRPVRRLRGLRMPVLPTGQWLAQVGGGIAALAGVYLQWGLAITLLAGGVSIAVLGALREAGKV